MLLAERNYVEKRDFIRMYVNAMVEVSDPTTGKTLQGEGRNLSGNGLALVTDQAPTLGAVVQIIMSSRNSKLPPLHADLKIVRVVLENSGRYDVAGELSNIR